MCSCWYIVYFAVPFLLFRYDIVGVLLIFIHDIGDVFLEGSKCFVYFKEQNGKLVKWVAICANVGFLLFSAE